MLEEVSLSVPAISKPRNVTIAPSVATSQFSINPHVTIPHSIGTSSDSPLRDMREWLLALQEPYPSSLVIPLDGVLGGLYFGLSWFPSKHMYQ